MAWVAGLPPCQQELLNHARAMMKGDLNESLKGFLASPPPSGPTPEGFLKIELIQKQFLTPFETSYRKYTGQPELKTEAAAGKEDEKAGKDADKPAEGGNNGNLATGVQDASKELLAQRLLVVEKEATAANVLATLQGSETFGDFPDSSRKRWLLRLL